MEKPKLSVFDLDHTLITVNSSYAFVDYLHQEGVISSWTLFKLLSTYAKFLFLRLPPHGLHEYFFENIGRGMSNAFVQKIVPDFLDTILPKKLYPPAIFALEDARSHGHQILLLSNSPDFLVGPIAERLGIKNWQSSKYLLDDNGNYARLAEVMDGPLKAEQTLDFASKWNVHQKNIHAYSDSQLDLPLLELAGVAVGVSPNRHLRGVCRLKGWKII